MKKIVMLLLAMLLVGVSVNSQNFVSSALPQDATTITVSDSHVYAFVPGFLYYAPIAKILEWQGLDVVPSSSPAISAGFFEDILFVLLQNKQLYSFVNNTWTLEKEGIDGMSVNDYGLFAWNNEKIFQYRAIWLTELNCSNVNYVAAVNREIIVIVANEIFHGSILENLTSFGIAEINIAKYIIGNNYYAYVGTDVMNGYAAYHISPSGICVPVNHILTPGFLGDVAEYDDKIYIAGRLGSKGVVFDAQDMSNINFFDEEILGICANDHALIAWDNKSLHMSINAVAAAREQKITSNCFSLITNPVSDFLQITSTEKIFVEIISLDGKKMGGFNLISGVNQIDVSAFPIGIYFISSYKGATKFVVK